MCQSYLQVFMFFGQPQKVKVRSHKNRAVFGQNLYQLFIGPFETQGNIIFLEQFNYTKKISQN